MCAMEKFIEAVKARPCLWKTNSHLYKDQEKRNVAWREVVAQLDNIDDVKMAKVEWKKIRDNHREALKRMRGGKPGQAGPSPTTWKHSRTMDFLVPFMKKRGRSVRRGPREQTASTTGDEARLPADTSFSEEPESGEDSFTDAIQNSRLQSTSDSRNNSSRRKHEDNGDWSNDRDSRRRHPLDTFFESMCESTKAMPQWLQLQVKKKLFEAITEAEEHIMQSYEPGEEQQRYHATSNPSTSTGSTPVFAPEITDIKFNVLGEEFV